MRSIVWGRRRGGGGEGTVLHPTFRVTHKSLRFLDKVFDTSIGLFKHYNAVLRRLGDLRNNDGALLAMAAVKRKKFTQRVCTSHVRIQHNEGLAIIQVLSCKSKRSSCK